MLKRRMAPCGRAQYGASSNTDSSRGTKNKAARTKLGGAQYRRSPPRPGVMSLLARENDFHVLEVADVPQVTAVIDCFEAPQGVA